MHPLELSHVWKRYRIGAGHESLRDAIPAVFNRLIRSNGHRLQEGEFWALQDLSCVVKKGETLGIIGRNGAGKSTVLKLLSRITQQTRGTIHVRGRLVALIELGGGFHPDLTGAENIYLQGTMLGLKHGQLKKLFDSIVSFSELDAFLQTPVKRYSSGMVVRLGFAIAAHIHPEILLIDEILAVGDLTFQQKCFRRIAELKAMGTTMIFISHNLNEVQKLCDRVVMLHEGRVIAEGHPQEVVRRYREAALTHVIKQSRTAERAIGPLCITGVSLRDREGLAVDALKTGTPLRIEVHYAALRPIHQPSFRVAIERSDGLLCHATSSHACLPLPSLTGEGAVTVEYPAMDLLQDIYQVVVQVFEGTNPIPVASLRQHCFFQVSGDHDQQEQGAVHLDHRWELRNGATS